ncbi:hypothetical protein F6X34_19925 [Dickeya dianthicola]|uniref:hypothetical protein n=1 Tax=Dickeya dianthicola TaxID=204039 RepID=UPI001384A64A|nr:hypothetical protein [Dickeya dianthicola]MZG45112.1 hypothetical protein [Dickeya dianthicola]
MITITKIKRFFMGALVGALILTFFNEIKEKQYVNRGYDPESGTTYLHQSTLVKSEILNGRLTQGSVIESFSAQIAFNKLHCLTKN